MFVYISTASFSVAVNGSLEGFFTSARGVWQSCSLSPYGYRVINNVLSKLLNEAEANGEFEYHRQCQGVNLTYFSFADDILVFTDGSVDSLDGVLEVRSRFARISRYMIVKHVTWGNTRLFRYMILTTVQPLSCFFLCLYIYKASQIWLNASYS